VAKCVDAGHFEMLGRRVVDVQGRTVIGYGGVGQYPTSLSIVMLAGGRWDMEAGDGVEGRNSFEHKIGRCRLPPSSQSVSAFAQ